MYDVITFGSATRDIYFKSKNFLSMRGEKFTSGQGVCFNLGSKIEAEDIFFSTGGGGTNTAATFAKQGFKTAYCGQVGADYFGSEIIKELNALKIGTELVSRSPKKMTNASVILMFPGQEDRAILVYRGASDFLGKKDIPWEKLKETKLFYLAPFSGKLADLTQDLIDFAVTNKIKVAINPGYNQLTLPSQKLEKILGKTDIVILNQEEASLLTKIPYKNEKEIFKKMDKMVFGIFAMTKGEKGVVVSDGKYLYMANAIKTKIVDSTGAGDAFGSGFVAGFLKKNDISFAIQLGIANATGNIKKIGAKTGILSKNQPFIKVKVNREKLF